MIPINKPFIGREEQDAVDEVMYSGVLTSASFEGGPKVREFEEKLQEYTGAKYAVAVNSGTSALYCSLLALGLKKPLVHVPSFTFAASVNAIKMADGIPLFRDIYLNDYLIAYQGHIDADVIMPVDLYGHLRDWSLIENGYVIEDACQAVGTTLRGKMAGTFGIMGCYSFYAAKVMTTGEGGCILTDSQSIAETLKMIRTHGQLSGYDTRILGGNFRMQEINAAIGIVQLEKLPTMIEKRRRNYKLIAEMLNNLPEVVLPSLEEGCEPNGYLFTFASTKRDKIKMRLNEAGIGATVYYPTPVNQFPLYLTELTVDALSNTKFAQKTVLSLPCHPDVTANDIQLMKDIIESVVKN